MTLKKIPLNVNTMNDVVLNGEPPNDNSDFEIIVEGSDVFLQYDSMDVDGYIKRSGGFFNNTPEKRADAADQLEGVLFYVLVPIFPTKEECDTALKDLDYGAEPWSASTITVNGVEYQTKIEYDIHW